MDVTEVRLPAQLDGLSGIVIPGGESTTMVKLMQLYGLDEALKTFYSEGGAVWGTCAGAIAVAQDVAGRPEQPRLGLLDIGVARNDYGRQVASFETDLAVTGFSSPFRAIFIRAPRITRIGPDIKVLASYQNDPVMVMYDRLLATVFHPELSGDDPRTRTFFRAGRQLDCILSASSTSAQVLVTAFEVPCHPL